MKELIRRVLRENLTPPSDRVDKKYAFKTKEQKIEEIEKNREYIKKILPKMIKFFELKFGDSLVDVSVRVEPYLFISADYKSERYVVTFLFDGTSKPETDMNRAYIWMDLDSFFNIDLKGWHIPLRLETKSTTPNKRY
jgi:hypothetical protein